MVHVVDDDLPFLKAVCRWLRAAGFTVRAYSSAESFLAEPVGDGPACVIVDLHMPAMSGLELQRAMLQVGRDAGVIFLSSNGNIPAAVRAIRDGAHEFLEKSTPKSRLLAVVSDALEQAENRFQQGARMKKISERFRTLSTREMEVLEHVVQGKLNKQIASDLGIAERTVKLHRTSITRKLGVPSVAELTRMAGAAGLFSDTCP